MKLDRLLTARSLDEAITMARHAETLGFDGVWSMENKHDPFLSLAVAATSTDRLQLGTAIALAFPRSPMSLAYTAWDLQRASAGRFVLGLGTQVKGHNQRRYGVQWESPGPKLREIVLALRAIWDCWQHGTKLDFQGEFYRHTLMTPAFSPGRIDHPHIPIYIAGVNPYICRLAGELCDGFHAHPFHSPTFLRERVLPQIEEGARKAGRSRNDVVVASSAFVIMGDSRAEIDTMRETVRRQIAFYASTRTYKPVLDVHGWGDVCLQLNAKAAKGEWQAMADDVTDEMLDAYAVTGAPAEIPALLRARYDGLLDRVAFYHQDRPGMNDARWQRIVRDFSA